MQKDIHPEVHNITLAIPNGIKIEVKSCYGKDGDVMHLESSPYDHPAWTGKTVEANERNTRIADFNSQFGNFDFLGEETK